MVKLANKQFKNWSEIERYLKKQINDVLINEVSEVVKDEIQSTLSDTVYSINLKDINKENILMVDLEIKRL